MRKSISLTILFTLLLSMLCINSYGNDKLTFTVDNVSGVIGESILVPINVTNNTGFNNVALRITYDPDVLEIIEITFPEPDMPANSQFQLTTYPGSQRISLINTRIINWTGNGTIANIEFKINPDAEVGKSNITITFTETPDGIPINADGEIVEADTVDGIITINTPKEKINIVLIIIIAIVVILLIIIINVLVKKKRRAKN